MKVGISIYCLDRAMAAGMSVYEAMDFAKENGAAHIELVPFHLPLVDEKEGKVNEDLCRRVREHAEKIGLEISAYSVNADLLDPDPAAYEKAHASCRPCLPRPLPQGIRRVSPCPCARPPAIC